MRPTCQGSGWKTTASSAPVTTGQWFESQTNQWKSGSSDSEIATQNNIGSLVSLLSMFFFMAVATGATGQILEYWMLAAHISCLTAVHCTAYFFSSLISLSYVVICKEDPTGCWETEVREGRISQVQYWGRTWRIQFGNIQGITEADQGNKTQSGIWTSHIPLLQRYLSSIVSVLFHIDVIDNQTLTVSGSNCDSEWDREWETDMYSDIDRLTEIVFLAYLSRVSNGRVAPAN